MAARETIITDIYGGIAISKKIGQDGSFRFGRHLDITTDPNDLTLQVTGTKDSASVVDGLVKWIVDATPFNTKRYAYDDAGAIYEIDGDTWTKLQTTANSSGQGLEVHNDYLYYTQDTQIGRYGPLSGTPAFTDAWQTGLNDTSGSSFAPLQVLNDRLVVGHGNYVGIWDGAVWDADQLILAAEVNVRALTLADNYVIIGAWRGTAVTDSEDGYVYSYDGLSDTFNEIFPTNGGVNAFQFYRNKLFSIHGRQGFMYADSAPFNKIHQIPGATRQQFVEVYPGAMSTWGELIVFGISDSNSSVVRGIYTYGSKSALFPEALNYAFTVSTGNSSTVQIGAVKGIGNDLYISWKDGSSYGVDKIDENSSFATSGTYESLVIDGAEYGTGPGESKRMEAVVVNHLPLVSGESIAIDYKLERSGSWSSETANSTVGSTETKLYLDSSSQEFKEFEFRTTLTGDGTSTPTVTQQKPRYNDHREEDDD